MRYGRSMTDHVVAVVLAAGAGSRFGGGKLLAPLAGRPVLQLVLDALADADLSDVIVVLGDDAPSIEAAIEWRTERRVVNPDPGRGLSSSLHIGVKAVAADAGAHAALILLGDQPLVPLEAIRAAPRCAVRSRPPGRRSRVPGRPRPQPCPPASPGVRACERG